MTSQDLIPDADGLNNESDERLPRGRSNEEDDEFERLGLLTQYIGQLARTTTGSRPSTSRERSTKTKLEQQAKAFSERTSGHSQQGLEPSGGPLQSHQPWQDTGQDENNHQTNGH